MKTTLIAVTLALAVSCGACAPVPGTPAAARAEHAVSLVGQLPGVMQSIDTLVQSGPMDHATAQQVSNYSAWASFIAQAAQIVLPVVLGGMK